nr:uncharacterized protein LOC116423983 isoform X1 [Nomia melanderi]XP_031825687.1 uncharacterized protein LOC116423983 isoform X1 [Nomia melanderi]XP_031825688.1 uncharacterized protein LOC116423983 isoform X1 [Nomia melanderi]XP_031825689.1 uncharacterized protein LOC116423983 isoform X1 [Nomia melanderi]XP_031825690.1 uncharacterized protein LOC116423983 isoform X1 [Nomia melanderi]
MYQARHATERTALTRPLDSPDYVEFASLLRTRKTRIRQFQCCICGILIAVFTMGLIVAVSYSVNQDIIDNTPNLTFSTQPSANLTGSLRLGFAPGGSYTLYSNPAFLPSSNSILIGDKNENPPPLSEEEYKEGLEAGRQAINERLFADASALASPLPSPSPEARHRYAVSTCSSVGALALAAIGELGATKAIENTRSILGETSAIGSFFDGGWLPRSVCKHLVPPDCPPSKYRTLDGSCNRQLQQGATMKPFRRVLPANYADGLETPRRSLSGAELPSAREVSLKVHKPSPSTNPHFTVMLAVYGQFLDHDITATAISQGVNGSSISCCPPSVGHPECFPVPVASGDPVFDVTSRTCMEFVRSAPAPQCKLGPRQQLNQVTAFIDGSAVYGSDVNTAHSLREFSGGRLKMQITPDNRTLLPASTNPTDGCNRETERQRGRYCFAAGDARANENLHLTTMHLLWARQHNRIADQLAKINPNWDEDTVYEETRRIIAAQMQHITYQEFLPIVLGETETALRGLRPLKTGYRDSSPDDPNFDPTIANSFASAAFRFAHTLLPGLMKMTDGQMGTSSYVELHRMLFNPYSLYAEGGVKSSVTSATGNVIQMTSTHVTSQLTNHLFEDPLGNVTLPCGLDLVSLNIQRGRDHGLPGYTKWRENCGLGKVESFSDLEGHLDPQALQDISSLYKSVHDVDLYTGALAEFPKADGLVGPTFTCLIADQFVRLQRGDRFWYETPDEPYSFTPDQLQELRKTTLAGLICGCSDGVTQTQAEVMRTVGPDNPMLSCEDIPKIVLDAWKETKSETPLLRASFAPLNWTEFKDSINSTIRDVVSYINSTRASAALDTDWAAFKNYVNNTFSDLRNQISGLHPPKPDPVPKEGSSIYPDTFILRSAGAVDVYQDWVSFKSDLVKSLNDSIGSMSSGPAAAANWAAFKQDIVNQLADVKAQVASMKADIKAQVASMKADLAPKLLKMSEEDIESLMKNNSLKDSMIPAIFDWKNFKDGITSSLDDTIADIGKNMPGPGDPAWATYGDDIKDKFSAIRDKIDSQKPAKQLGAGTSDSGDDWLSYKADIVKTINDAVKEIKDKMPPPGDPAWATYRDEIIKSFSVFRTTQSPQELATLPSVDNSVNEAKLTKIEVSDLTKDWQSFHSQINDSLTRIIQDIQSKKPTTVDPVGWTAFRDSITNDFAKLKDEISNMKAEWTAEVDKPKPDKDSPSLQAAAKNGDSSKFDYTKFTKPVIPADEWISFKKQINDTLMNLLRDANDTGRIDLEEVRGIFDESFADLRNEISSLRDLIGRSGWKKADDWISFQKQLNSTIEVLVDTVQDGSKVSAGDMLKILIDTKDKFADLEPPTGVPAEDWSQYSSSVSKTLSDALKVINSKSSASMLKSETPDASSSDNPKSLPEWLLVPCIASIAHWLSSSTIGILVC